MNRPLKCNIERFVFVAVIATTITVFLVLIGGGINEIHAINSESPDLLRGLVIAILVAKKEVETADVIPVVRCFECERSEPYCDSQSALTCREFGCTVPRDGFCHEGRRNQCLND